MLLRGDTRHDIAAYFGIGGGRIAEIARREDPYPTADAMPADRLPPANPYFTKYALNAVMESLTKVIRALEMAEARRRLRM